MATTQTPAPAPCPDVAAGRFHPRRCPTCHAQGCCTHCREEATQ